ncbi:MULTISPECIES: precorrin-6y C5,15-methyltransferase (decarboxylating) subunit CbiE [unclassified Lentimonas]|uniref:precorrin-6y C5,15-methyltransferase (decarboxylating) subunit CbiE n=1 Tax=unclassified Lentimonas TaxID=2630993 RepID=UPI00132675D6|nr:MULTISPECIES: precorrin-6y C5,15-methyltransferase (decarboxylating) subunit CbiE [unclassified Lentimonas]CAA6679499.1 Cobalt-precorrin-6y C5-methyltransferase (EC / Cobalt-precorrin-6y C15-methyltransferase [decarboxylating] (EC [Lentimonas sp. CC4]CAA6687170.1 Cobalt-precorrin-6y C5-methyltransferase (EC / Cobalt-precorrin-6y C15-methyltransferase [decarboxylating] (EC [Lentimonas sp. CC6]CAA7075483.1 Cobalt-precorrin-6y C5-methyltransferase (EC / Cobalt-precorrin-6y C15-methyltransferase 
MIHVISCGTCYEDLSQRARQVVENCDLLYGGTRLLEWFQDTRAKLRPLTKALDQELDVLIKESQQMEIAVLASGDSLFFGIAAKLARRVPADALNIVPGISAMQAAFAHLGIDWSGARFYSIHGRDSTVLPWRVILQQPSAVVYGDHQRTPAWIAAELIRQHPEAATRQASIAENLGSDQAHIETATLEALTQSDCGGLSMLILHTVGKAIESPALSLGLADDHYAHVKGLITHPEVRAIALSKLRLKAGVLWDLGAGSGSVGIEAAGLCANVQVYSVEKSAERVAMIEQNRTAEGLNHLTVIEGDALTSIPQLPDPDAVFIGGGGKQVGALIEAALQRLTPGGHIVATAVLADTIEQLNHSATEHRTEWLEIGVRRARTLAHSSLFDSDTPINIFVFKKR